MATPSSEDWSSVGQIIGDLFAGGVIAFLTLYRTFSKREETSHARLVAKSVGAAFVDGSTSENIASIAEDIRFIRGYVEDLKKEEERQDTITEALSRLKAAEEERKRLQSQQG